MKIPIVNEQDEVIAHKEREKKMPEDIYRITHVWVFNKNKEFLIAKRQATKKVSPNRWGPGVSGTLEEGETYESNAVKETEEEIGLKNISLTPYKKIYYENSNGKRFCFIYVASINMPAGEFVLQKEEVSEVKWINIDELVKWYKKSPDDFIPSVGHTIVLVKEYLNDNQS